MNAAIANFIAKARGNAATVSDLSDLRALLNSARPHPDFKIDGFLATAVVDSTGLSRVRTSAPYDAARLSHLVETLEKLVALLPSEEQI